MVHVPKICFCLAKIFFAVYVFFRNRLNKSTQFEYACNRFSPEVGLQVFMLFCMQESYREQTRIDVMIFVNTKAPALFPALRIHQCLSIFIEGFLSSVEHPPVCV